MKIVQMLSTISYGDAIGNHVMALRDAIAGMGYETAVYAENIHPKMKKELIQPIPKFFEIEEQDVILYHLSTGTKLNHALRKYPGRKIIIYHNITPPYFFRGYSANAVRLCTEGIRGMQRLAAEASYCLAVSSFNKDDLRKAGYHCKIDVLPVLIAFEDYKQKPNRRIIQNYAKDGYTNILFTGRIAPNKKQEDVIRIFYQYQKKYNPKSRLILVGSYEGMQNYYDRLLDYVDRLGMKNVIFTGHIRFQELLAYYKIADAFVCMSEHEGFCVPLVEAMYFQVPILAYDSTAIGETLGGCGFLTHTKDPLLNAGLLNYILSNPFVKQALIKNGKERLADFENSRIAAQFERYIKIFLGEQNEK